MGREPEIAPGREPEIIPPYIPGGRMRGGEWFAPCEPASNDETIAFMRQQQGNGFWYIASPYSKYPSGPVQAFVDVCHVGGWLINQGVHIFVPIAHSHPLAMWGDVNPQTHAIWLEQDFAIAHYAVGMCIVKMPMWESSFGISEERKLFASLHKPEVFLTWPLPDGGDAWLSRQN